MRNKDKESPESLEYNGDAITAYYNNVEMSKLTDSEPEFMPADDEWQHSSKKTKDTKTIKSKLEDFLENDFEDNGDSFFFTDENDDFVLRKQGLKHHRDLASG